MPSTSNQPPTGVTLRSPSRRRRALAYGVVLTPLLLTVAASLVVILWTIGFPVLLGGPDSATLLRQRHLSYTWFDLASGPGRGLWLILDMLLVLAADVAIRLHYGLAYGRRHRVFGFLMLLWFAGGVATAVTAILTPGGLRPFLTAHHPIAHGVSAVSIALPLLMYEGLAAYCLWRILVLARRRS